MPPAGLFTSTMYMTNGSGTWQLEWITIMNAAKDLPQLAVRAMKEGVVDRDR